MLEALMLEALAQTLRGSKGIAHKRDIDAVVAGLGLGAGAIRIGDDCAALPDGDGFLLFAIEGFMNEFVADMPWFAGYCGVMVNVSDIAAMGGRPVAVVDALWSASHAAAGPVLEGLGKAAAVYGVPVVGGHTNTRSDRGQLSVAILGRAKKLLTSFDARPGDVLVAAIDLRGDYHEPYVYWDASTRGATPERLRGDLEILPHLAEDRLVLAAKDISMGGLAGTALMLLESSGVGGTIDIAAVPRPDGVALERWLQSFPSYGFLLSVAPANVPQVLARFAGRDIAAAAIGEVHAGGQVWLTHGNERALLWDFSSSALIGCAPRRAA